VVTIGGAPPDDYKLRMGEQLRWLQFGFHLEPALDGPFLIELKDAELPIKFPLTTLWVLEPQEIAMVLGVHLEKRRPFLHFSDFGGVPRTVDSSWEGHPYGPLLRNTFTANSFIQLPWRNVDPVLAERIIELVPGQESGAPQAIRFQLALLVAPNIVLPVDEHTQFVNLPTPRRSSGRPSLQELADIYIFNQPRWPRKSAIDIIYRSWGPPREEDGRRPLLYSGRYSDVPRHVNHRPSDTPRPINDDFYLSRFIPFLSAFQDELLQGSRLTMRDFVAEEKVLLTVEQGAEERIDFWTATEARDLGVGVVVELIFEKGESRRIDLIRLGSMRELFRDR
jgi:hypothetical protein